jgi:acetoacetyl-CoA synthetase
VPYTISGKKVEQAVRLALAGRPVTNRDALANPEALDQFRPGMLEE